MTYTKIDVMVELAKEWGDRRALNWTPMTGCTEYDPRNKNPICIIRRLNACWAREITGKGFGEIVYLPGNFDEPLRRKKSAVILLAWRSDIADAQQDKLFEFIRIIQRCSHHAVFGLTKKPKLLGEKLEPLRGLDFPSNLHLGVSLNVQAELHRLRDFDSYLCGLGAYFVFIEPAIGKWQYQAVKLTLERCPSLRENIKWLVVGGWSSLTDEEVTAKAPVDSMSVKNIIWAVQDCGIPVALKHNLPLEIQAQFESAFPQEPAYLDVPVTTHPGLF